MLEKGKKYYTFACFILSDKICWVSEGERKSCTLLNKPILLLIRNKNLRLLEPNNDL